ncbi:unnamed protein product, partial [Rotaria magnacalcarata]
MQFQVDAYIQFRYGVLGKLIQVVSIMEITRGFGFNPVMSDA